MILVSLASLAYRVHVPKWAYAPTSGAGAAVHGGRANRPGVNALYLSLDLDTALLEYQQLDSLMPPGLMVSYSVKVTPIVDFSAGYSAQWDLLWQDFHCDWRALYFNAGIEPPSWVVGDMVIAVGAKGIIFKSSRADAGRNLVLFNDTLQTDDEVVAYDPDGALPKDQASWQ